MKPMELGGIPSKIDNYFHWGPIFYGCSPAWNRVVFLKKLMNIFTWDLYSMYVVLQGIGSLSCIRVYIIYVIPFGE